MTLRLRLRRSFLSFPSVARRALTQPAPGVKFSRSGVTGNGFVPDMPFISPCGVGPRFAGEFLRVVEHSSRGGAW